MKPINNTTTNTINNNTITHRLADIAVQGLTREALGNGSRDLVRITFGAGKHDRLAQPATLTHTVYSQQVDEDAAVGIRGHLHSQHPGLCEVVSATGWMSMRSIDACHATRLQRDGNTLRQV